MTIAGTGLRTAEIKAQQDIQKNTTEDTDKSMISELVMCSISEQFGKTRDLT